MSIKLDRTAFSTTLALLLSALCELAPAKTIYVDNDATGANNGTSWTDAYVYLQDALADANDSPKPVEICVAQGIYKPDQGANQTPGDREATFHLINGVTLKGGFAGSRAPDPNLSDIEAYATILSGDLSGDDVEVADPGHLRVEPTRSENSYHVVTGDSVDETAVLDGFVITAGATIGGGGMRNVYSSPIVANCAFSGNSQLRGSSEEWASVGGMYNYESSPTLTNCIFNGNSGLYCGGMENRYSNPTLFSCTFSKNSGGGMYNVESSPTLTNCIFSENSGHDGGGMENRNNSSPTLTDCSFSGNSARESGGGGMSNSNSNPNLTNCTLSGNWAHDGGGMYNDSSSPTLTNCTFSGNSAERNGGGMYNVRSSPTLTGCTLGQNYAQDGSALACDSWAQILPSNVELINCILWNGGNEIWNYDDSTIVITYSNIQGGFPGEGNSDADPLFADPGYWADPNDPTIVAEPNDPNAVWIDGDYHLKSETGRWDPVVGSWVRDDVTSLCIDAGNPNSDWGQEVWPHGRRINMGVYGGTPEASLSAEPQAMSLPRVAYIYENDVEAAQSFGSLLTRYGCATRVIALSEVVTVVSDSHDLIIVGNDTGLSGHWGDADSVAAIDASGKPVLGIGEGGYAFFGQLGLSIGWPNGGHGERNSISVIDPNSPLFKTPYAIDVPEDLSLRLYTETDHVGLYLWPVPETVTLLGGEVDNPGYYPLVLEDDRYLFWGFSASAENMTEVGKNLFINVVVRAANAAWATRAN